MKGGAATDFFGRQKHAKRAARSLVAFYVLSVAAVVAMLLIPLVLIKYTVVKVWMLDQINGYSRYPHAMTLINLGGGLVALMLTVTLVRIGKLRKGGRVLMRLVGAVRLDANTTDPDHRRLVNVAQEMAIAAAVPMPTLYLLEYEAGINAFVAGHGPTDAALCVTRGCLDRLNRDELQGIIAHEFSHIVNGDMKLNINMSGLFGGVFFMGATGRAILFNASKRKDKGSDGMTLLLGVTMLVVGSVGLVLGMLAQAWISRSREYLADAAAIQYTRQQRGLVGALKKILAFKEGSLMTGFDPTEISHMLFGPGRLQRALLSAHPDVPKRIKALGARYDQREIFDILRSWHEPTPPRDAAESVARMAAQTVERPVVESFANATEAHAMPAVGKVGDAELSHAARCLESLSDTWTKSVHDESNAWAMVLAFTVSGPEDHVALARIESWFDADVRAQVSALIKAGGAIPRQAQMALLMLATPCLLSKPPLRLERMEAVLKDWSREDGQIDMHEYCLLYLLRMYAREAQNPSGVRSIGTGRLYDNRDHFGLLCALMAQAGGLDDARARSVWQVVMDRAIPGHGVTYSVPSGWQDRLDTVLNLLDELRPDHKRQVVESLSLIVLADRKVTLPETELLRLVCACLHCPLPPFVSTAAIS